MTCYLRVLLFVAGVVPAVLLEGIDESDQFRSGHHRGEIHHRSADRHPLVE
jgi:hypothetical protein